VQFNSAQACALPSWVEERVLDQLSCFCVPQCLDQPAGISTPATENASDSGKSKGNR
jgi:hypothetical protein